MTQRRKKTQFKKGEPQLASFGDPLMDLCSEMLVVAAEDAKALNRGDRQYFIHSEEEKFTDEEEYIVWDEFEQWLESDQFKWICDLLDQDEDFIRKGLRDLLYA